MRCMGLSKDLITITSLASMIMIPERSSYDLPIVSLKGLLRIAACNMRYNFKELQSISYLCFLYSSYHYDNTKHSYNVS